VAWVKEEKIPIIDKEKGEERKKKSPRLSYIPKENPGNVPRKGVIPVCASSDQTKPPGKLRGGLTSIYASTITGITGYLIGGVPIV